MNKYTKHEQLKWIHGDTLQVKKSLLTSIALLGFFGVCTAIGMGV